MPSAVSGKTPTASSSGAAIGGASSLDPARIPSCPDDTARRLQNGDWKLVFLMACGACDLKCTKAFGFPSGIEPEWANLSCSIDAMRALPLPSTAE